ncbi:DUF58 domain-containing protein [Alteromonas sediminis]|uniref:DUF58 domain-containing protein n=1 Tax=Alteromonas sediminis TaxID=2259342 RepID=A0A3N5Z8K1_9ALTE|nr:DUF58 domain-containing protein [Alteromonas sediminis]RPJ67194.1 DUF58 domain-containing protein [Alteromonas sediminis]
MQQVIKRSLSNWFVSWLKRRIPAGKEQSLSHSKIFILPSRFGVWFIALCGLLFVLGTNYQNNLMRLLCTFLLSLFLLHMLASYINFSRLRIKALKIEAVFAGKESAAPIMISFDGKMAQGVVHFSWWRSNLNDTGSAMLSDNPTFADVPFTLTNRGHATLPRLTIRSDYPLGLFKCWTHLDLDQHLIVYPAPVKCDIKMYELASEEEAVSKVTKGGFDDFHALREYSPSDPLSNVAWKQVAKTNEWLVKTFDQPVSSSGWLTWASASSQDTEQRLSQLTYQIIQLSEHNAIFGLALPDLTVPPGKGNTHMHKCLNALALYRLTDKTVHA